MGKDVSAPQAELTAPLLKETIKKWYPVRRAICVEGSPGTGKTTVCREAADEINAEMQAAAGTTERLFGYQELHMPTKVVEDFGIPKLVKVEGTDLELLTFSTPDWFPAEGRKDVPDCGLLCLDDRTQANTDLQKVIANIIQARTLHGTKMKAGWMVISTGNRQSDRAGAVRTLSHLRNRETVIPFAVDFDAWMEWAIKNANLHPDVMGFLDSFKDHLIKSKDVDKDAMPTPRSWVEGVSNLIDITPPRALRSAIEGAVGMSTATAFFGWKELKDKLPTFKEIVADPEGAELPEERNLLFAICGILAHSASVDTAEPIFKYIARFKAKEFQVLAVKRAVMFCTELAATKPMKDWCADPANRKLVMQVI